MCGLWTRRGAGKLVPGKMRSKEWWMMKRKYVFKTLLNHKNSYSEDEHLKLLQDYFQYGKKTESCVVEELTIEKYPLF